MTISKLAWCPDPRDLVRIAMAVYNDTHPSQIADAAYVFANTPENEISPLQAGAMLYAQRETPLLCLCGGDPYIPPEAPAGTPVSYAGFEAWKKRLTQNGIPEAAIRGIDRLALSHTGTEAENFVRLAKNEKWQNVYVVALPQHLLRAYTNTVTAALRLYPELNIYAVPGTPCDWTERALLNQQGTSGVRLDEGVNGELERIERWFAKGDLESAATILDYYRRREQREKS